MTIQHLKEWIERDVNDEAYGSAVRHLMNYILELEKRIEKLEAKDFTRNEPLIGGYDY